jgi:hypothetical protein
MSASKTKVARRGPTWWQGVICGALLTFAPGMALLLAALLAPAFAALAADTEEEKGMTRAVTLACTAASLSPAWHLWNAGDSLGAAMVQLTDPMTLGLAWGSGAIAWSLCEVIPAVVESVWKAQEAMRANAIEKEMAKLRDEWRLE